MGRSSLLLVFQEIMPYCFLIKLTILNNKHDFINNMLPFFRITCAFYRRSKGGPAIGGPATELIESSPKRYLIMCSLVRSVSHKAEFNRHSVKRSHIKQIRIRTDARPVAAQETNSSQTTPLCFFQKSFFFDQNLKPLGTMGPYIGPKGGGGGGQGQGQQESPHKD